MTRDDSLRLASPHLASPRLAYLASPLKVTMFIDAAGRFAFDASELTRACARRRGI